MAIEFSKSKSATNANERLMKLKKVRNLALSPVDYVVELLEAYLEGEVTGQQLQEQYFAQTRKAQFLLSYMPRHEIEANRKIFHREYAFGDSLTQVMLCDEVVADEVALRKALIRCMDTYLAQNP